MGSTGLEKEELRKVRGLPPVPLATKSNYWLPSNSRIQNELFNRVTKLFRGSNLHPQVPVGSSYLPLLDLDINIVPT